MAELLGRRAECDALDRLVADVLAGTSRVLVLSGDAGVGKSALLDYLSDRVASEAGGGGGWGVVSAVGVESEMELAYSGLHQLCAPLLDHLDELPVPQRDALATVFGLSAGPAPDRFLVGLATLTLLAQAAEHHPLACIIDDAQWLDPASAQIIAFVARRLLAERVALVCAARTGIEGGVAGRAARAAGRRTARQRRAAAAAGPRARPARCGHRRPDHRGEPRQPSRAPRAAAHLGGGAVSPEDTGSPAASRWPARSKRSYVQRLELLPPDTQLLVLTAAAEPLGDPALLRRAADALGIDMVARPRPRTPGWSRCAGAWSSPTRWSGPPPTAPPPPATGTARMAPWPRLPTPRRTRTGAPGTGRAPPPGPMRKWRANWSGRPTGPGLVPDSRPPPPS